MDLHLKKLIGQLIASLEKRDYTWFFNFSGGASLATEQAWRLIGGNRILVTSDDHAQKFGVTKPVDAAEVLRKELSSASIVSTSYNARTGDLLLNFSEDRYVEFLQMSSGYESWRLLIENQQFVCLGGGDYAAFEQPG